MNNLIQDLWFAVRLLSKNRGFTAVAVITLALGIGANTAIFSLVNRVLLSPLPFKDPQELVRIQSWIDLYKSPSAVAGADYLDWRERSRKVIHLTAVNQGCQFILTGDGEPASLKAWRVSPSFFELFGIQPLHGRMFRPDEEDDGNRGVVLTQGFWERRFGGNPAVVGKKVIMNGEPCEIIGVMPRTLGFIEDMVEVMGPLPASQLKGNRGNHYLQVFGRLAPGVTLDQARAELSGIAGQIEKEDPAAKGWGVSMNYVQDDIVGSVRMAFLVLNGVACFVLLIVCVNVANLMLARSAARSREMAVRFALGAGRGRIIRQLLTESVLVALLGGALGVLLAYGGLDLLKAICPRFNGGRGAFIDEVSIDARVLAFTAMISVLTGLGFGLIPALQAARVSLSESLKESDRSTRSRNHFRFLGFFTTAQLALSLVLLVGAGLMVRSYYAVQKVNPGFDPANILRVETDLPFGKYGDLQRNAAFYGDLMHRIEALPGVESVSLNNLPPMCGVNCNNAFVVEGRPAQEPGHWIAAEYRQVSHEYFQSMRIPLKKGRYFTRQDDGKVTVMIINDTMARRYFPNEDPIGKRIRMGDSSFEIVGIVADEKQFGLMSDMSPVMYQPYQQACWNRMSVLVRTRVPPENMVKPVQQAIWAVDPDQPVSKITTMSEMIADGVSIQSFVLKLFCVFAAVALVLAAVGVYGVMAYITSQRTHEIGIRVALGANTQDILMMFLKQGLVRMGLGLGIGVALSLGLSVVIDKLLYQMSARDPLTLGLVSFALGIVAMAACFIPARRAAKVDPMVALRYE